MKITFEVDAEQFTLNAIKNALHGVGITVDDVQWEQEREPHDGAQYCHHGTEEGKCEPCKTEVHIPAENNGAAIEEAAVEPEANDQEFDHVLSDIQALVSTVEESGLRTRKEIVAMLNEREVKKFTELNITALKEVRDELMSIAATLED